MQHPNTGENIHHSIKWAMPIPGKWDEMERKDVKIFCVLYLTMKELD